MPPRATSPSSSYLPTRTATEGDAGGGGQACGRVAAWLKDSSGGSMWKEAVSWAVCDGAASGAVSAADSRTGWFSGSWAPGFIPSPDGARVPTVLIIRFRKHSDKNAPEHCARGQVSDSRAHGVQYPASPGVNGRLATVG